MSNWIEDLKTFYSNNYPKSKEYPNFKIMELSNDLYSISKDWKNIDWFDDASWKTLLNISNVRKRMSYKPTKDEITIFDVVQLRLWVYEKLNEQTWEYEIFKAEYSVQLNWKFELKNLWERIPQNSKEYFKLWMDMYFVSLRISLSSTNKNWEDYVTELMKHKAINIFDLIKQKNNGQLTQELFDKYKYEIEKMLPDQIMDSRFSLDSKWWSNLLEKYKPQISEEVYEKSLEQIKRLEIKEKDIKWMLWNEFKKELKDLQTWIA